MYVALSAEYIRMYESMSITSRRKTKFDRFVDPNVSYICINESIVIELFFRLKIHKKVICYTRFDIGYLNFQSHC